MRRGNEPRFYERSQELIFDVLPAFLSRFPLLDSGAAYLALDLLTWLFFFLTVKQDKHDLTYVFLKGKLFPKLIKVVVSVSCKHQVLLPVS